MNSLSFGNLPFFFKQKKYLLKLQCVPWSFSKETCGRQGDRREPVHRLELLRRLGADFWPWRAELFYMEHFLSTEKVLGSDKWIGVWTCIYIQIHTYIHIYMHIYIYVYTHICIHLYQGQTFSKYFSKYMTNFLKKCPLWFLLLHPIPLSLSPPPPSSLSPLCRSWDNF